MNRRRRPAGFTVIEMVIAIAVAVSMIVAVYSATRSMSDTAKRQKEMALQNMRQQKFADILRHDLRGWVVQTQSGAISAAAISTPSESEGSQSLLQFNTTADGLSSAVQAGSADPMRAITKLQYSLRKNGDAFQIVRIETGADGKGSELVLQSAQALKMEFFDGTKWVSQWSGRQRPTLIRITSADYARVIGI